SLLAALAVNLEIVVVQIVEGEPAKLLDADASVQQHQHEGVVAKAQRCFQVAYPKEQAQMFVREAHPESLLADRLWQPGSWTLGDDLLICEPPEQEFDRFDIPLHGRRAGCMAVELTWPARVNRARGPLLRVNKELPQVSDGDLLHVAHPL